jgi:hypothetical protein
MRELKEYGVIQGEDMSISLADSSADGKKAWIRVRGIDCDLPYGKKASCSVLISEKQAKKLVIALEKFIAD